MSLYVQQKQNTIADRQYILQKTRREAAEARLAENLLPGSTFEANLDRSLYGRGTRTVKRITDLIPGLGVLIRGGKRTELPTKGTRFRRMERRGQRR